MTISRRYGIIFCSRIWCSNYKVDVVICIIILFKLSGRDSKITKCVGLWNFIKQLWPTIYISISILISSSLGFCVSDGYFYTICKLTWNMLRNLLLKLKCIIKSKNTDALNLIKIISLHTSRYKVRYCRLDSFENSCNFLSVLAARHVVHCSFKISCSYDKVHVLTTSNIKIEWFWTALKRCWEEIWFK